MIETKDDWVTVAIECELDDCLYCLYGEITDEDEPPFPICLKHLDTTRFTLDKAGIPNSIRR